MMMKPFAMFGIRHIQNAKLTMQLDERRTRRTTRQAEPSALAVPLMIARDFRGAELKDKS